MVEINLLDLKALKVPACATKEQKELIQNLKNIKRERDIEEEYKRLKDRLTSPEELSKQQKKCY